LWLNHLFRIDINLSNLNKLFGFLIGNNLKLYIVKRPIYNLFL